MTTAFVRGAGPLAPDTGADRDSAVIGALPGAAEPAGAAAGGGAGPGQVLGWLGSRNGGRLACLTLLLELGLVTGFAVVYKPFDLQIYLWGGRAVTEGLRLYLVAPHASWFTYPPFAAVLFTPLAALPATAVRVGWELASVAALAWACMLALRLAGGWPSRTAVLATVAASLALEPMYHTLFLGQVNLFLLALVLADVSRAARGRRAGIGVGIATAVKLTPGIFIVLFLLTRRSKDAVRAGVTFACCTLAGFLVDPGASRLYWAHLCYDTGRVGGAYISNQSPYGAVARWLDGTGHVGIWYGAIPVALAVAGLAVAAPLGRQGDWLGAAAVTGVTGLLVSPISWTHHWVWVMPALVVLARGGIRCRLAAAFGYLLFALAPMWWTPHAGRSGDYGMHGVLTLAANCFLIAGLAFMICMTLRVRGARATSAAGGARRSQMASTFGMISSFSRLRSSSVFDTGTSANGGQMSSRFSPASFSRLRLSVTCAAVPTSRLLPFPIGV